MLHLSAGTIVAGIIGALLAVPKTLREPGDDPEGTAEGHPAPT
ncbi:MAG: hypothetical protein Q8Q02_11195 [Nocardioides sp.]|nr:hypothetical protein [Nocardioides sp.]